MIRELGSPLSILVVEDNDMFLRLAMEMLHGYKTTSAKTGADGLEKYKKLNPDIIFLDIGLPDKSGIDVLMEIKKHDPASFVVMLTASNIEKDVRESQKHGASGYIIKPFSRKKIKDIIDSYYKIII